MTTGYKIYEKRQSAGGRNVEVSEMKGNERFIP
jgi:hypothetical protein